MFLLLDPHKVAAPTSTGGWVAFGCVCGDVWPRQRRLLGLEAV